MKNILPREALSFLDDIIPSQNHDLTEYQLDSDPGQGIEAGL